MHEAEVLCNRLVIMNKGIVAGHGSPKELINQHTPGYVGIFSGDDREQVNKITNNNAAYNLVEDTSGLYVRTNTLDALTTLHTKNNLTPLQIRPSNLEDVFLKLTGQDLTVDA